MKYDDYGICFDIGNIRKGKDGNLSKYSNGLLSNNLPPTLVNTVHPL